VSDSIVITEGLTKAFTSEAGVFELDLELPSGLIIGFIGPSGSGKTTTVRLMSGLLRPDSGNIRVLDEVPTRFDADTRARIGYMPQEAILYPDLTLAENLDFAASLYGIGRDRKEKTSRLIDFLDLDSATERMPGEASGGERRRLMLAATLLHDPDLLFLDEPTAGIDPVLRRRIWDRLEDLSEGGRSLIVTTQYVGEAAYCDYVAVLVNGRVLTFDTPDGLRTSAYGGEMIDVVFARRPDRETVTSLEEAVAGEQLKWLDGRTIRLLIDDAGAAGPKINTWGQNRGVELLETEPYIPSFDDVFVDLVDRLDDNASPSDEVTRARERSDSEMREPEADRGRHLAG
jgi:ABC-2 type transport system ATP-binding protein